MIKQGFVNIIDNEKYVLDLISDDELGLVLSSCRLKEDGSIFERVRVPITQDEIKDLICVLRCAGGNIEREPSEVTALMKSLQFFRNAEND